MEIKDIKILVPGYLTNALFPFIMKQNDEEAVFGVKTDSIYSLMSEDDSNKKSEEEILFEICDRLSKDRESFSVFSKVLDKISFVEQFVNFYKECICYDIDIADLPEDSDEEIEIKKIIRIIDSLNPDIRKNHFRFNEKKKDHLIFNDLYGQYTEYRLLKKCIDEGNERFAMDDLFPAQTQNSYMKASTRGKELDALARYIINSCDPSATQVVIPKGIYTQDIARVFEAHDISFRRIGYSSESMMVKRIREFIDFLINRDLRSLLVVLRHDNEFDRFCDYAAHFDIGIEEIEKPFNRFSFIDQDSIGKIEQKIINTGDTEERNRLRQERDEILKQYRLLDIIDWSRIRPLIELEKDAEKIRKQIGEKIRSWMNDDPYRSLLDHYNETAEKTDWKEYENDKAAFSRAGRVIVEGRKRGSELKVLRELIDRCLSSDSKKDSNAILVTDMDHLMMGKKTTIVVGGDEGQFLPTLEKNQIIKEDYVAKIGAYPTLEERLEFSQLKMDCLKKISPELVISYCYSDYSGKQHKLSSYIENTFDKTEDEFEEWPQEDHEYVKEKDSSIRKEKAQALFVGKDNGISGSVSSLELYQNCPYNYFLQKGIGISELEGYQEVDPAVLGTLRHRIFELLADDRFSDPSKLDGILDEYMDELKKVYDSETDELELKRKMIGNILKLNEIIARKISEKTNTQSRQEYRLDKERVDAGDYHFNFTAIVDRIDYDDDYYRVVDYKSSNVRFSTLKFDSGQQLQLMTYLWLLWKKKQMDGEPAGIYYFDLNLAKENDLKKAAESFNDPEKGYSLFENRNRLQGFSLFSSTKTPEKYEDVKNRGLLDLVSSTSDLRSQESKDSYDIHRIEDIDRFLSELYRNIATNITEGKFAPNPSDETCRYCSFSSICHKEAQEESEQEDE